MRPLPKEHSDWHTGHTTNICWQAGLDWHVYRKLVRTLPTEHRTHLKTWIQGTIHFRDQGKPKMCPLCGVPATPKHIVWLRKWHHGRGHKPMPAEWANRITTHDEEPLWNSGWIPLEPQEQRQVQHPYHGHGNCQGLPVLQPHQYQGWAFTLDATPSTYDCRSQLWASALVAGLAALAKHTSTAVKVIVQLATVWEIWTNPKHRQTCQDLLHDLTDDDFHRVTVLYISKNTRSPDTPGSEPHLRRRQRDAVLTAWERASSHKDHKATEWQAVLDQDHEEIYRHAAARLALVFADKQHYLHQKAPRHHAHQTKQHKKQLVHQRRKPWQAPYHRWQPHRSGYQCSACGERVHQALTAETITDKLAQQCPQLLLLEEEHPEQHSPHQPIQRKLTRAQIIANLIAKQTAQQPESQLDAQQRPILTAVLKKPCKGAPIGASPPLTEIFRRQTAQASQSDDKQTRRSPDPSPANVKDKAKIQAGHEPQPNQDHRATPGLADSTSPIVPRQLTYQAALTTPAQTPLSPALPSGTMPWAQGHDAAARTSDTSSQKQRSAALPRDRPEANNDGMQEDATSESSQDPDFEVDYF